VNRALSDQPIKSCVLIRDSRDEIFDAVRRLLRHIEFSQSDRLSQGLVLGHGRSGPAADN